MNLRRHAVLIPVSLIVTDRLITALHWHHESNPVVNGLGLSGWLILSAFLIVGMLWLWYRTEVSQSRVSVACIAFLSVLMGTVVVTNGLYVTGLWPF